jgi:N-acetylmuramoyl-L-alanine amidase
MPLDLPLARAPNAGLDGWSSGRGTLSGVLAATRNRLFVCVLLALTLAGCCATASASAAPQSLRGRTIALDPGHNGGNGAAASAINRLVAIGGGRRKACDTTGTSTNAGYPEAAYTWDVALRARRVLRRRGAKVVLSRENNRSVGPCIDERARFANRAHADLKVSIHADGGPPSGFGFHVIEPASIPGLTDDIFRPSHRLAVSMRSAFRAATGAPYANYIGERGLDRRDDLGGLRLSDVPAVFVETANMRNAADARKLVRASYRLTVARGIANGIERFLRG